MVVTMQDSVLDLVASASTLVIAALMVIGSLALVI
jgi:hypothetical protein